MKVKDFNTSFLY